MKMRFLFLLFTPLMAAVLLTGCDRTKPGEFQGYIEGEYVYVAPP